MEPQTTSSRVERRPVAGLGWGAVVGAAAGVSAALAFFLLLFGLGLSEGPTDVTGDDLAFMLIIVAIGSVVGAVIGSAIGAPIGLILGITRSERWARFVAPMAGAIPFVIGPRMLEGDWTFGHVVSMVIMAMVYAVIGWKAGRVFANKLHEADLADEAKSGGDNEQAEINRLVEMQQ